MVRPINQPTTKLLVDLADGANMRRFLFGFYSKFHMEKFPNDFILLKVNYESF